jgi:3'(2'), 5'-bisphosphate nucleotidase
MTETLVNRADHDSPPAADAAFARWLAGLAGDLLTDLRAELGYADPKALRKAGDARSHELIAGRLAHYRPNDAVLSEEAADDHARLAAERVWIVDPLDGTREFGEEGRGDWAVHIALWQAERLVAGAVALPAQHRILATDSPPAYPPLSLGGPLRFAASRTRAPEFLTGLVEEMGAELVPMGSAGAKIAAVIDGEVDAYVHAGGQYEWDSAAPVAVATSTGLHASRLDGSALEYNRSNPRLPDLVVCRKDLAPRLLTAIARFAG